MASAGSQLDGAAHEGGLGDPSGGDGAIGEKLHGAGRRIQRGRRAGLGGSREVREWRIVAEGVRACVGSPSRREIYAVLDDRRVCRLDADSGQVLQVLGESSQDAVTLSIDPAETALWEAAERMGRLASDAPDEETLTAYALDGSGVVRQADVSGHQVFGSWFLSGTLITAGWDGTVRIWDPHQPMPLATVAGSSPFRCVAAARDRIVAGDQRGNVWFLAPMGDLGA
jgi:WD40 repeat protein